MAYRQIRKILYTIYAITSTLAGLPHTLIINLFPSLRPHPRWTYYQSLMNHLMKAFLYHASILEMKTTISLEPGSDGPNFIAISPAESNVYHNILSPTPKILPTVVGGVWYPSVPESLRHNNDDGATARTILYFHGGAFVIGTARPDVSGFAAQTLNHAFQPGTRTLAFSYRLASSGPSCAFPAAVQDALTTYFFLLNHEGIPADQIIFAGDSAGCNIAIALLRYIASSENSDAPLPSPLAAILCSPWVDVHATRHTDFLARYRSVRTDYVPGELQMWGARTYMPGTAASGQEMDEYISPLHRPFRTTARICVIVGSEEVLAPEGMEWAEEMKGMGCQIMVELAALANHAVLGVGGIMGFAGEADRALGVARRWLLED